MSDPPKDEQPYDPDNPIHVLSFAILQFIQMHQPPMSPMGHIISLAFAQSQIAHAIDLQAQEIISLEVTNDFMGRAANQAGFSAPPLVQTIEWDPEDTVLPPLCTYCLEKAPPVEIEAIVKGNKTAKASCNRCKTQYILTLPGEPTQ